jgi:undecaprenyl-diphosphatase
MNLALLFKATLLAIICGVTEFLPISSNGHVVVLKELLGFTGPSGKMFELSLQLGAISAVCWFYRAKLRHTLLGLTTNASDRQFAGKIFLAFLPVAIMGALFHHVITTYLFNAHVVAVMLIVGGLAILAIERFKPAVRVQTLDGITLKSALLIGLVQILALIPGVSRSGATIMGALLLGVERKAATEFSFFLAIPVIFAAGVYDIFKNRHELSYDSSLLLAFGFGVAFACALIVVKWLLSYLTRHGFVPFAWYRIIVGTLVLALLALR